MKILTNLSAASTEGYLPEERGTITAVHDEPVSGFFRLARLTGNALVLSHGKTAVAIPLADLFQLAATHEPVLQQPQLVPEPEPAPAAQE